MNNRTEIFKSHILLIKRCFFLALISVFFLIGNGCESSFLDAIPDKKIVVPSTLADVRAILNNTTRMNAQYPGTQEVLADDYYLPDENYDPLAGMAIGLAYLWEKDVFLTESNDWSISYTTIFYTNVALETLDKMEVSDSEVDEWRRLKGQALFFRSFSFYHLMQLFAKPYEENASLTDLGVVLKLSADINEPMKRATVKECYDQITTDLVKSIDLLPINQPYKTLPTVGAANALLARVYLTMSDYVSALKYAQKALEQTDELMDYNTLDKLSLKPFESFNKEVILHASLFNQPTSLTRIAKELYDLYNENDLRKDLYFLKSENTDIIDYKGGYSGSRVLFGGLAVNELYLIIAECYARQNEQQKSLNVLNKLLEKRYDNKFSYVPIVETSQVDVLATVLRERRKELFFRGLRWSDLRRYSFHESVNIKRVHKQNIYELKSNEISSYMLKIPYQVVVGNGLIQND